MAMRRRDIVALRVLTPRGVRIAGVIRILGFSALFFILFGGFVLLFVVLVFLPLVVCCDGVWLCVRGRLVRVRVSGGDAALAGDVGPLLCQRGGW